MLPPPVSLLQFDQHQWHPLEPGTKSVKCKICYTASSQLHVSGYLVSGDAPAPDGLHEEHPLVPGELDQLPGLPQVDGQRLLAEHRLARLQVQPGQGQVGGVDGAHIHNLECWISRDKDL